MIASQGHELTEIVGSNIEQLRKMRGWTRAELASRTGLSASYLHHLEKGRRWIGPRSVRSIARELGVPCSELFEEGERTRAPEPGQVVAALCEELGLKVIDWKRFRRAVARL